MTLTPAIFIDRDGTINEDAGYLSSPDDLVLYPWAAEALRLINASGRKAIVVTNQSGVARGLCSEADLGDIHARMITELEERGAYLDAIYYCPHHPDFGGKEYRQDCTCRKPKPGMLRRAAEDHNLDLSRSYVIGDKAVDINLAESAGARGVLVLTGFGRTVVRQPEQYSCRPHHVAENLLDAVRYILGE